MQSRACLTRTASRPGQNCSMSGIWDSDTSTFVVALSSVGTLLTALTAAVFAWRQIREARRTREAQAQPFVVVDIQPGRVWVNLLTLVIQNTGTTLARDVRIAFDPPLTTSLTDSKLPGGVLVSEGITALPPGRRIEMLFDLSHERLEQQLPMRYTVTVDFSDFRRRRMSQLAYVVDLTYLYEMRIIGEKSVHDIAVSLDEIRQEIQRWRSTQGPGLAVWTRDADLNINDERWQYALTGKHRSIAHPQLREWAKWPGRLAIVRAAVVEYREWRERRSPQS